MNKKQRRILEQIFENPIRKNIKYSDVENLLFSLGVQKMEGSGSRVVFYTQELSLKMHKPHPQKEIKPYQVIDIRQFLLRIGVSP